MKISENPSGHGNQTGRGVPGFQVSHRQKGRSQGAALHPSLQRRVPEAERQWAQNGSSTETKKHGSHICHWHSYNDPLF